MKKRLSFLLILLLFLTINVQAETYDGEYSIDYLLKNYSVVTLGQKGLAENGNTFINGNLYYTNEQNNANINGAVLVSGDVYRANNYNTNYTLMIGSSSEAIKSYIKGTIGNNVMVSSQVNDSNYLDFNKMYEEVMKESQTIAENTKYYINNKNLEVSIPGIYTIQNTASLKYISGFATRNNSLLIKNYDRNSIYVFNYYNDIVYTNTMPNIMIMENGATNAISLSDYINSGNYTGNIIFNFPNAKIINIEYLDQFFGLYYGCENNSLQKCEGINANIVAPNADVYIKNGSFYNNNTFYGTIISNSLSLVTDIQNSKYTLNKKIAEANSYIVNTRDYNDDFYSRDYSIKDLLENYSLVTLGHKAISSNAKLSNLTDRNGSVRLFHITGQALINGDMIYDEQGFISAFDLQSNKVTESYINGKNFKDSYNQSAGGYTVIQPWDNMDNDNTKYMYQKNSLLIENESPTLSLTGVTNYQGLFTSSIHNYISFDRLYDNVVSEQAAIAEGKTLKVGEDGTVHIPIGGSYTIEDISNVKEVIFDNFDKEKDELTIVTVKNSGDINFPLISKDTGSYKGIVTNDYYGKEQATHLYEQDTFVEDSYHGNIIWNVPNATYIKLKENAPFAGHLIAPNADVDTPELHFAGCFIVNSIYGEGNTEAHFYPITAQLKCDCEGYDNLDEGMKMKFSEYRLSKLLGGDASTIETEILGDETQYREDNTTLENVYNECPSNSSASSISNNPIVSILTNPKTYRNLGLIIVLGGLMTYTIINKKKQKTEK